MSDGPCASAARVHVRLRGERLSSPDQRVRRRSRPGLMCYLPGAKGEGRPYRGCMTQSDAVDPDQPGQSHDVPATEDAELGRDRVADERDRRADEREQLADERDRRAHEREEIADEREHLADERERRLDASHEEIDARRRLSRDSADARADQTLALIEDAREALERSRARLDRNEAAFGDARRYADRDQGEIDRETARSDRDS